MFRKLQPELDAERLLFFDETGINLAMARRHARAERGERALGFVPKNWGQSTTLIAGIGLRGLVAPMVIDGSLDGDFFEAYFERSVVPILRPSDVVVIDNLSVHKRARVKKLVEQRKAELLFLPPYSPDLNPIELAWSKLKEFLRSKKPRTVDELVAAVATAIDDVTSDDLKGWITHCGYNQRKREPL